MRKTIQDQTEHGSKLIKRDNKKRVRKVPKDIHQNSDSNFVGTIFLPVLKKSMCSIYHFFISRGFFGWPLGHIDELFRQHINSYSCGTVFVSTI